MKKLSLILAITLVISLFAACGNKPANPSTSSDLANSSETSSIDSTADSTSSDVKTDSSDISSDSSSGTSSEKDESTSTSSTPSNSQTSSTPSGNGNKDTISYITQGLVARYDFEDANNIGKDVSGNNNNLHVWSNTGKTVGQIKNSLNDKLGNAASFKGDALLAAKTLADSKNPSKDFLDSINGSYTITFFAKNNLTQAKAGEEIHCNLICNGYWNSPTTPNLEFAYTYMKDGAWDSFASYINYGGIMNNLVFRKFVWQGDNSSVYKYGKIDTNWYHYAIVVNTEKVCVDVYIDGNLIKSNSPGTQKLATQSEEVPFSIGGMAVPMEDVPVRDLLIGEIDDVRIYNRTLSLYEIKNIKSFKG